MPWIWHGKFQRIYLRKEKDRNGTLEVWPFPIWLTKQQQVLKHGRIFKLAVELVGCVVISPQTYHMKLFVAGLPNDFDDVDLKEMFELYGEVKSAKLVIDRATGKSKGFGFVEMPNKTEAMETMEALDGAGLKHGKKIAVKEAEEQRRR